MKRALCLLSGGFDSPVAAYRIAKAGYSVDYLFFYSLPFVRKKDREIVEECARILGRKTGQKPVLFILDNELLLENLQQNADENLHVVMRRLMMKIAEKLAKKHGFSALVTGDSLAQVSSQTLSNMEAISRAVRITILRPLLGFDKEETIRISRRLGLYDVSKQHKDCGLGAVSKARTKASEKELKAAEKRIGAPGLIRSALSSVNIIEYRQLSGRQGQGR